MALWQTGRTSIDMAVQHPKAQGEATYSRIKDGRIRPEHYALNSTMKSPGSCIAGGPGGPAVLESTVLRQ